MGRCANVWCCRVELLLELSEQPNEMIRDDDMIPFNAASRFGLGVDSCIETLGGICLAY